MGGKSKPPPGPDYTELLALTAKYAKKNDQLMREYLDFGKESLASQEAISEKITAIQLPAMEAEAKFAQQARDRYVNMGIPFEDKYLDKITNWDSSEKRDERAGAAQAGVTMATEAAREAEIRKLEGYGIDPSQVRSSAMDSKLRLSSAVARAAAGNTERLAVEREGLALGGEAVNLYRGLPSQSAEALATATNAGQTAFGNQGALGAAGAGVYTGAANMNQAGSNMTSQGYQVANSIYGNNLSGYELEQQNDPMRGIGQLAGTALGAASGAGSFGNLFNFTAEGGRVGGDGMVRSAPVQNGIPTSAAAPPTPGPVRMNRAEGGQENMAATPRPPGQGIPQDKIPAMLSMGEQVVPSDVSSWMGEKYFSDMNNKARKDRTAYEAQRDQNQMDMGIPLTA